MLSLLGKNWILKNTSSAPLTQKLLHNRNLKTEEEIEGFLNPDPQKDFHDPFLMRDMERAVTRITAALKKKERIMVFGDYDVDGMSGSALLIHTLRDLSRHIHKLSDDAIPPTVSYRLPHRRDDGYGLREKFIREFLKLNVKVLITVDNGVSAHQEITLAQNLGVDVIITDHHTLPKILPPALAILHPALPNDTYPFPSLTGSGVAFKLAKALIFRNFPEKQYDEKLLPLLDLACLGTIADLGPLRGENRLIVKYGLKMLEETRWPGLSRLKESAGIQGKVDTRAVGFFLSPRLNAAGRIAHPHYALQLLLGEGESLEKLAAHLNELNQKRQQMVEESIEEAFSQGEKQKRNGQKILVAFHTDWHSGIIGLIAAKMVEQFGIPSIAMEDRGDSLVGSARSIPDCSIVQALDSTSSLLLAFGGHAQAAGFEILKEHLPAFQAGLETHASRAWQHVDFTPQLSLECEMKADEISLETLDLLEHFEPFGFGNETPVFLIRGVTVKEMQTVGKNNKHLKFFLGCGGKIYRGIGFNFGKRMTDIVASEPYDLAVELQKNEWNGTKKAEVKIVDMKPANPI